MRFLITVHSKIPIAQALREQGHDVAFYTGRGARAAVKGEGFVLFSFQRIDEERLQSIVFSERRPVPYWRRARRHTAVLRSWLLDTLSQQVADQTEVLEVWQRDAGVSDVTMWGMPLVLHEKRDIPVAVFSFTHGCMVPGPDAPPWGLGLPRSGNRGGRLRNRVVGMAANFLVAEFRRTADALRPLRQGDAGRGESN